MWSMVFFYFLGIIESLVCFVGGLIFYEGCLEIFYEGRWGMVCNNGFDVIVVKIICNSIGYLRYKIIYI